MGTGSVESLVLKWLRRLPTVPVPFFGRFFTPVYSLSNSSRTGWTTSANLPAVSRSQATNLRIQHRLLMNHYGSPIVNSIDAWLSFWLSRSSIVS